MYKMTNTEMKIAKLFEITKYKMGTAKMNQDQTIIIGTIVKDKISIKEDRKIDVELQIRRKKMIADGAVVASRKIKIEYLINALKAIQATGTESVVIELMNYTGVRLKDELDSRGVVSPIFLSSEHKIKKDFRPDDIPIENKIITRACVACYYDTDCDFKYTEHPIDEAHFVISKLGDSQ